MSGEAILADESKVLFVGGMPGIFPIAGFPLPPHWLEIYHLSLGRLLSPSLV